MHKVYEPNKDIMLTYLRGRLAGMEFTQSQRALAFVIKVYGDKQRRDGSPGIIHPVMMACLAIACGHVTDTTIAVALLHDVSEDCKIPVSALPFDGTIKNGVRMMTIEKIEGETKDEERRRYFYGLLGQVDAIICKGFDRYHNLNTMEGVFTEEDIQKNIIETHKFLLPVLKKAKNEYPEFSDVFHILSTMLKGTISMLAYNHNVKLEEYPTF